ncbi:poly [ADP-ribose] polymerase tankyrase-2-like [Octopus sinensis]|uniref:Poly [ADP-ribose] polymerase tankyrase-2-like n=1 Tax=Octopus sinensis TaxID=2607531 RepID=A0A6P7U3V7_9MOLL|nr:poly [ADP-ribose] polymerase tankyrase-2-like [Octopus sinensis]
MPTDLHDWVYQNCVISLENYLNRHSSTVDIKDEEGKSPLHIATTYSRVTSTTLLLKAGANPNARRTNGLTPLHDAVERGCAQIVELFIDCENCDLDIKNGNGDTALIRAAYYDYADIVKMLIDAGADAEIRNNCGQTALLVSLWEGSINTAEFLIESNCDLEVIDLNGHSALYAAIHSELLPDKDIAKRLVKAGYDVQRDMWWLNRSRFRFRLQLSTDLENKNTKETKPPSHVKAAPVSNRPTKKVTQGKRPSGVGKPGKPPSNVKLEKRPSNSLKQEKCSSFKTTSESSSASRVIKHRVSSTSVTENLPPETLKFEKHTPKAITFENCTQESSMFAKHKGKLFGNRHRKSVALENCVPRTVTLDNKTPERSRKRVTFADRPPTRITFSDISNNHRKQFSFSSLFSKLKRHGVK